METNAPLTRDETSEPSPTAMLATALPDNLDAAFVVQHSARLIDRQAVDLAQSDVQNSDGDHATKVKALSPHDRFVIALRSPMESGKSDCAYDLQRKAPENLLPGFEPHTFSSAV